MKQFTITYTGKQISNNQMKSLHWRKLKPMVDEIKKQMHLLCLEARPERMKLFEVECRYNSRLDLDNLTATIKPAVDILVSMGILPDDSKKFWKKLTIKPDESLKNNTMTLTFTEA